MKVGKFISTTFFVSILAFAISAYNLWDNNFRFKLNVAVGKQCKLMTGKIDESNRRPVILMSLAFTNSGGKTSYLDDVKLIVTLNSNNLEIWKEEFVAIREYDTLLSKAEIIKQTEILPIVIVGKTTVVKKYAFIPSNDVEQSNIPESFDLCVEVQVKQRNRWQSQKKYEKRNLGNIWQNLKKQGKANNKVIDIFEKK